MNLIDYANILDNRARGKNTSLVGKMLEKLKQANVEIFLVESPYNHYQPAPPVGFCGFRSNKRRIFLPLNNGCYPKNAQALIDAKEYIEAPL